MELVYLWVEDYKNIHHQGFHFSPRFTCQYNEATQELSITKNEEHVSIFPPNINITAIVGENGSGKSSLLEALSDLLSQSYSSKNIVQDEKYRKYLLVYKYSGKYYYLASNIQEEISVVDKFKKKISWITPNPNKDYLFYLHSDLIALIIDNQLKHKKIYRDYNRVFTEHTQSDRTRIKKIIVNNLLDYKNTIFKKDTAKFFIPKKIIIKIKNYNLFTKDKEEYEEDVWSEIESYKTIIEENLKNRNYQNAFSNIITVLDIKQNKHKQVPFLTVDLGNNLKKKDKFYFMDTYSYSSKLETGNHSIENIYPKTFENVPKKALPNNILYEWKIEELNPKNSKIVDFIFDLPEIAFDIELKDDEKSFESLSYGETQIITQLNFILFHSKKKIYTSESIDFNEDENGQDVDINVDFQINNMIVLLDEFELGLHPNWQKKFIVYLVDFLKLFNINFHIVITSHSPFILSDIPKENVIFLEKYKTDEDKNQKEGNCKNVTSEINIETFGANIHTLLSHGFFMKDGLMGEFAKGKINEVKEFYDKVKKSKNPQKTYLKKYNENKKDFENIQRIIGEPFLKTIMKNYLNELEILFHGKKEFLDKEINRLEKLRESLDDKA